MFGLSFTALITIIIAIIGWAIAIWKTMIANRYKKSAVIFENRFKIYNDYFDKIDNINERLMIDFQVFIGPKVNQVFRAILAEPNSSSQSLIEMHEALNLIVSKAMKTITQTTQELQRLRFIATKETLDILDEYKKLAESQTTKISELLSTIKIQDSMNFDAAKNGELIAIGEKLIKVRNNLERQMRDDLGID